MMFWDNEVGALVSLDDLRAVWEEDPDLQSEYGSFDVYLSCCMVEEGGTLEAVK